MLRSSRPSGRARRSMVMLTETMLMEGVEAMADRAMIVNMVKAP
jgi:hypothetical protein